MRFFMGDLIVYKKAISMQVGDKVLSEYMVSLVKQLKKIEQYSVPGYEA